jgi:hypothetical protein
MLLLTFYRGSETQLAGKTHHMEEVGQINRQPAMAHGGWWYFG